MVRLCCWVIAGDGAAALADAGFVGGDGGFVGGGGFGECVHQPP